MKKLIALILILIMTVALLLPAFVSVAAVSPSDAVVNIDFANGIPDGMEVVGAELVSDPVKGQVMSFTGSTGGINGSTSKAAMPMESLATTDFSKGISWTVWVKGTSATHGMHPIFNIDLTRIGYLTLLADLVVTANSDGNETSWGIERVWSDPPNPLEDEISLIGEEWMHLSVVINAGGVFLYKNGKLYERDPWANGSFSNIPEVMLEQMSYATGVTLGAYGCDWWKFGDFSGQISSAALYNKTLTADDIKELYINSGGVYVEDPTEAPTNPPTEAPADAPADEVPTGEDQANTTPAKNNAGNNDDDSESDSGNNNLILILAIAGGVVVLAIVIVIIITGKKGKKE